VPRALFCLLVLACAGSRPALESRDAAGTGAPSAELWRAPPAATNPLRLRVWPVPVEPRSGSTGETPALAARVGQPVDLRRDGSAAAHARCRWSDDEGRAGQLPLPARSSPGVVEVRCAAGVDLAFAQITYTDARQLPVRNPYGGGVLLLKTRRTPPGLAGPVGTQELGLGSLDHLLRALGAHALPAFPFDRSGTRDRVGLARWIVVDLPERTNFYQAVALLRADPAILAESYVAEDAGFLRVATRPGWPEPLVAALPNALQPLDLEGSSEIAPADSRMPRGDVDPGWALAAIGAPRAWSRATGSGVTVAVVDTGVDVNHLALSRNLVLEDTEGRGQDGDGNGIPGDELGVNFAHLAIGQGDGPPRLALGLSADVSDWDGIDEVRSGRALGHGTAIAALIAGSPAASGFVGVAPDASILPVDVQENPLPGDGPRLGEDPRMRPLPLDSPLRSGVWARAAGIVYAVSEGARVLTCAWASEAPHWILHDALLFAEDNCALAVCAAQDEGGRYPGAWLPPRASGTGAVYDAWTGGLEADFFRRPLRATLLVGAEADASSDLIAPGGGSRRGIETAVSSPRTDLAPLGSRRLASFQGAGMSVGLAAGVAALVTELRPDLEPWEIRETLVRAAGTARRLDAPGALERATLRAEGGCRTPAERHQQLRVERRPWWKRIRVRKEYERTSPDDPPAARRPGTADRGR
jgi:subtilisin family serine protease